MFTRWILYLGLCLTHITASYGETEPTRHRQQQDDEDSLGENRDSGYSSSLSDTHKGEEIINEQSPGNSQTTVAPLKEFPKFTLVTHPLVQHKLTIMRDKTTGSLLFRQLLTEIGLLMGYEVTRFLEIREKLVETPVAMAKGVSIDENNVVIVPILRAGLGMAEGLQKLIPTARQGHIGIYRDPETKKAVEYYFKMPTIADQTFIVVDPMLATGNSAVAAIEKLTERGIPLEKIIFMALVAAPEGVKTLSKKFPSLSIFSAALDERLNDHAYIVPGLGDAGDRIFGTK